MPQEASPRAHFFNNRSLILDGNLYHKLFVRLQRDPVLFPENHLGLRDLQFIAFAPHGLDEDRQVQLSAAGHQKRVRGIRFIDAQRDIGLQFFIEAIAKMARGEVFAFATGKGARID